MSKTYKMMETDPLWLLKANRIKITPQRAAILSAFITGHHLTGEQIYSKIKGAIPGISLSTVYNTLDLFERKGIINSFEANGMRWYETRTETHVNIYDSGTNTVRDVELDLSDLFRQLKNNKVEPEKINIVIYSQVNK